MGLEKDLIQRYQLCETSPEEERALLSYLEEDEKHRQELVDADFLFAASLLQAGLPVRRRRRALLRWTAVGAAAAVLLAALATYFLYRRPSPSATTLADNVIEAPVADLTRISLPDGSLIILKAGSSLSYGETFGSSDRNVTLTGEAYFDVAHDTELPFIVSAGNYRVKVLGTVFQVRALEGEHAVETMLASGSVEIFREDGSGQLLLHPGERAVCDRAGLSYSVDKVRPWETLMENFGTITMHEAPVREICEVIEHVFGIQTEIDEREYADSVVTFGFNKTTDPETVLELLSLISQNKITLKR